MHAVAPLLVQTPLFSSNFKVMAATFYPQILLILLFYFVVFLPSANSVYFKLSRFDPSSDKILYKGDAEPSVGTIEFNKLNYVCRVGWAIYAEKLPLWDSSTRKITDFKTHYSFIIDTRGISPYGQGFAFFLAPVGFQIPPNSAGGFLGLFNTTTSDSSRNQIVLVEFDSFPNPEWDPPMEHVGINNNSISSSVYTRWNASLHSGDTADVWITYNATTKNLSVSWKYQRTPNPEEHTSLSYQIDLMKVLPEWITVGFSAATGSTLERHTLLSWEFNSTLDIKEMNENKAEKIRLVVGLSVSGGVLIAGAIIAYVILWRWKIKKREAAEMENLTSINDDLERGVGPKRFSYRDLVLATNNFSSERKLGQGGFGAVYRGYLVDVDMAVAVKKISRGSRQGKKEYITEVKIISRLRHRNLVQLIGWCHDRGEFHLVYEYMLNGSLDYHLFGNKTPLSWALRHRISLGLASALLYLHEEWEQCVVHRDIKSSNIMLDSSFNVKLGDFGLARLTEHERTPKTTGLVELKSVDFVERDSRVVLLEWVWYLYGRGEAISAVDKKLDTDFEHKQVECLMIVGLWCAHPDRNLRPSIRQAIQVLNFEAPVPNIPKKMPLLVFHAPVPSSSFSESSVTKSSLSLGP
ncbi:Lectin receptor kinase [Quillaja saponaria]|uniref:Lectin receptor kinase n=1 Tax=Quillaja saponaria TaxID=32244 RepID=A0AAD7PFZ8_QUISA|nr:Lectin receptor kinase [Quillaja saponaria]